jgi:hypothetical protein
MGEFVAYINAYYFSTTDIKLRSIYAIFNCHLALAKCGCNY